MNQRKRKSKINKRLTGRPPKGNVSEPDIKEKNVVIGRGILRQTVNFFKKGLSREYFNGRVENTMFKGFTSSDSEFKKEVEDAIRAMKNSKTDDYESKADKILSNN